MQSLNNCSAMITPILCCLHHTLNLDSDLASSLNSQCSQNNISLSAILFNYFIINSFIITPPKKGLLYMPILIFVCLIIFLLIRIYCYKNQSSEKENTLKDISFILKIIPMPHLKKKCIIIYIINILSVYSNLYLIFCLFSYSY